MPIFGEPAGQFEVEREKLVRENPALAEQIRQGIAEAEAGKTVDLGSFAHFLTEDDEEE